MVRPVPARQPSIRWGRYWIFFSLRLTMRTRLARSAAWLTSGKASATLVRKTLLHGTLGPTTGRAPILLGDVSRRE